MGNLINRVINSIFNNNEQPRIRKRLTKEIRDEVWNKYHNSDIGKCYCCNKEIERYNAGWHCSHVKAWNKGGEDVINNLRTCCRKCNLSMGDQNLYVYIKEKELKGLGSQNVETYLDNNRSQIFDKRTNNWKKSN